MTILEIIIFGMFFTLFGVVTFITSLIVLMIAILPSQCWLEE
jgi:membrane protein implicated in regulation of membrane protease activity